MALELRGYLLTDAGVALSGWTVNVRNARKTGAPNAILYTTTTDVNGMWEFVDGSGGVTLSASQLYDVDATSGSHQRWRRGYDSPSISITDLQISPTANITLTKLDEGTIDDTVDPATTPTTLQARLSQFAALLKRLGGGSTFNAPSAGGNRNALVNGTFDVWQRGTSISLTTASVFTSDRWLYQNAGAGPGTITASRDTSVPTVGVNAINTPYSFKAAVTGADAAIAAGDLYMFQQYIEGFDYRPLTNGFTCSFWTCHHRTGTYCVAFGNSGVNRAYVAEYTQNVADTWEYKTVVVATPPTAGTWDYTTGIGLRVSFVLAGGSTYQTTANAWNSVNAYCTSNQINGVAATSDIFRLALVNLTPGAVAQPLAPVPIADQLARCQRYCQVYGGTGTSEAVASGYASSATNAFLLKLLPVSMQGTPTLTISAAADWTVAGTANQACTALTLTAGASSPHAVHFTATVAAGLTAGQAQTLGASITTNARITLEANPA